MNGSQKLHYADYIVIVLYFVAVIAIGIWSTCKNRRGGVTGYFLAGRSMTWFLIGGSLYGSNIGTEHFIGLSGSASINGIVGAGFELQGMFTLIVLGWIFLPVYISSEVYTMPEYLMKRFGGRRIQTYLACLTLILSIIVKTSVDLFSGSIFIQTVLGWNLYASIGLQLVIAAISTVGGGLTAVMWTDTMQVMLLIVGSVIVMIIGFEKVGGYHSLVEKFMLAVPSSNATIPGESRCAALPSPYAMQLLRPLDTDFPWTGMTFGVACNAIWYWCCDQVIVQKALAGKTFTHSKGGCLMTGFLKFLPLWMMIFPGMISRILFTDIVACTNPDFCEQACDSRGGCSNIAYPLLVLHILPIGIRGVLIAVMMAAIMSNITSTFNSCSTVFTMDVWHACRKNASQLELLVVGRIFIVIMIITSIIWIPIIESFPSSQLINYVQSVQSYMGPPICAIFLLGIFVPRVNEQGAFWGLVFGLLIGMTRLILEISYGSRSCDAVDNRPSILKDVHYLHFATLLMFMVSCFAIITSLATKPLPPSRIERLTFWTRHHKKPDAISNGDNGTKDDSHGVLERQNPIKEQKLVDMMHFICGTVDDNEPEGQRAAQKHVISLQEDISWKRVCDLVALLLFSFGIFVYVFWA